jgi:hypothetical protein
MGFGRLFRNIFTIGAESLKGFGRQIGHEMREHPVVESILAKKGAAKAAGEELEREGLGGYVRSHFKKPTTDLGKGVAGFLKTRHGQYITAGVGSGLLGLWTADKDSTPAERWGRAGLFAAGGMYLTKRFRDPVARKALKKSWKALRNAVSGNWAEITEEGNVVRYWTDESGQRWSHENFTPFYASENRRGEKIKWDKAFPGETEDETVRLGFHEKPRRAGELPKGWKKGGKRRLNKTPIIVGHPPGSLRRQIVQRRATYSEGRWERLEYATEEFRKFLGLGPSKPMTFGRKLRNYGIAMGIGAVYGAIDPHRSMVEGAMGGAAIYMGARMIRKHATRIYLDANSHMAGKAAEIHNRSVLAMEEMTKAQISGAEKKIAEFERRAGKEIRLDPDLAEDVSVDFTKDIEKQRKIIDEAREELAKSAMSQRVARWMPPVEKTSKFFGKQPLIRLGAGIGLVSAGLYGAENDPTGWGEDRDDWGMAGQILSRTAKGAGLGAAAKVALKHPMMAMALGMGGMRLEGARRKGYETYLAGGRVGVAPLDADGDLALSLHTIRHGY